MYGPLFGGLNGVNEKLLKHAGVTHIPTMLGSDEVPEALTSDGGGKVFLATNHRFVEIETSLMKGTVQKVTSHLYQDMVEFEADKGFLAVGFSMTTRQGTRSLAAQKNGREEFAAVVKSHMRESQPENPVSSVPGNPVASPNQTEELPDGALWFASGVNGQVTLLEDRIRIERKGGLAFLSYGFRGTKEILIREMSSIEYKDAGGMLNGHILFLYRGGRDVKTSVFGNDSIASNEKRRHI